MMYISSNKNKQKYQFNQKVNITNPWKLHTIYHITQNFQIKQAKTKYFDQKKTK